MRYYKLTANGYLVAIGTGEGGTEMTEEEYNAIFDLIRNKPPAPDATHEYWITEGGEYELVEVEPLPDEEPTAEELLDIITGVAE